MPTKIWSRLPNADLLDAFIFYREDGSDRAVLVPRTMLPRELPRFLTDSMVANIKATLRVIGEA